MQTAVSILRDLWRGRVWVALFAVIALVSGLLVAYRPGLPPESRKYEVGVAGARILVDTPDSQVVAIAGPSPAGDLGGHTSLLAQLMAEGDAKAAIARRAGVPVSKLVTVAPTADSSSAAPSLDPREQHVEILAIQTLTDDSGNQLPIIDVETQAADAAHAARLANAAVSGLSDYLSSKAAADKVPDRRRLEVRALGTAVGQDTSRGPGPVLAVLTTILVFGLLCGGLLLVYALARGWRAASAAEKLGPAPAPLPEPVPFPTPAEHAPSAPHPAPAAPRRAKSRQARAAQAPAEAAADDADEHVLRWSDPPTAV